MTRQIYVGSGEQGSHARRGGAYPAGGYGGGGGAQSGQRGYSLGGSDPAANYWSGMFQDDPKGPGGKSHWRKVREATGYGKTDAQRDAERGQKKSMQQQYTETQGVLNNMAQADTSYLQAMSKHNANYWDEATPHMQDYQNQLSQLGQEASAQATHANNVYTGQVFPNLQNMMEDNRNQAAQAMTLQQAGDPNNQVHTAVRNLYNKEAEATGARGMADVGVLQGLGTQATAQQFGQGGAMSGAQLGALQSANLGQASMAMSNAQNQMNKLRQQGIQQGFVESDRQYQRGQQAKDRYRQSVGDMMTGEQGYQDMMQRYRQERGDIYGDKMGMGVGMANQRYGMNTGTSGLAHQLAMGRENRQLGAIDMYYGGQQGLMQAQMQAAAAEQAGKRDLLGNIITGGGKVAGSYFHGAGAGGGGGGG